jgi:hypothetical protein
LQVRKPIGGNGDVRELPEPRGNAVGDVASFDDSGNDAVRCAHPACRGGGERDRRAEGHRVYRPDAEGIAVNQDRASHRGNVNREDAPGKPVAGHARSNRAARVQLPEGRR